MDNLKIRDKLKEAQMRLVELATYLDISRPTLYKYLELYENKEYNEIDKKCFDLFSFIDNNKNIQRHIIMEYLINKVIPLKETNGSDIEVISWVRKLSESFNDNDKKKLKIIGIIASSNKFDDIIDALVKLSSTKARVTLDSIKKTIEIGEK